MYLRPRRRSLVFQVHSEYNEQFVLYLVYSPIIPPVDVFFIKYAGSEKNKAHCVFFSL